MFHGPGSMRCLVALYGLLPILDAFVQELLAEVANKKEPDDQFAGGVTTFF
jgi:hypothetical protein